jgi:hypothetical protein
LGCIALFGTDCNKSFEKTLIAISRAQRGHAVVEQEKEFQVKMNERVKRKSNKSFEKTLIAISRAQGGHAVVEQEKEFQVKMNERVKRNKSFEKTLITISRAQKSVF